ncbi:MAG TPA: 50S ribosomal protein L6 [Candidatus Megaira endosymbiont of Hartmannula sinica]|nr:50S ribosomal protein L6 [Candidatus Megaera endosymbiont of Hartmannula sinica]
MSRVGKIKINIPENVDISIAGNRVSVSGPNGKLQKNIAGNLSFQVEDNNLKVSPLDLSPFTKAMWGTARSIISNMVNGVNKGFKEVIEMVGVGYRATISNNFINLFLGKSHNTKILIPDFISANINKQGEIELSSYDLEKLGQYVAIIKSQRPSEPYKGKGIRKKNEYVYRKEGKKS